MHDVLGRRVVVERLDDSAGTDPQQEEETQTGTENDSQHHTVNIDACHTRLEDR